MNKLISDMKQMAENHHRKSSNNQRMSGKVANYPQPSELMQFVSRSSEVSDILKNLKDFRKNRRYHRPLNTKPVSGLANRSLSNPRANVGPERSAKRFSGFSPIEKLANITTKMRSPFAEQDMSKAAGSRKHQRRGEATNKGWKKENKEMSRNGNYPFFVSRLLNVNKPKPGIGRKLPGQQSFENHASAADFNSTEKSELSKRSRSCARPTHGGDVSTKQGERAREMVRRIEEDRLGHTNVIVPSTNSVKSMYNHSYGKNSKELKEIHESVKSYLSESKESSYYRNGRNRNFKRSEKCLAQSALERSQQLCKSNTEQSFGHLSTTTIMQHINSAFFPLNNESVEDIHYFFVAFHQRAKNMLGKVENGVPDKKCRAKEVGPEPDPLVAIVSVEEYDEESDIY